MFRSLGRYQAFSLALILLSTPATWAINRSWDDGGIGDNWNLTNNWSPNGNPGGDDLFIGDLPQGAGEQTIVNFDFNIESLTVTNGASVDTDGNRLTINGPASFSGVSTVLRLREATSQLAGLTTESLTVGANGRVDMHDNSAMIIGNGVLTNSGTISGNGVIRLFDNPASPTSLLINNETLTVGSPGVLFPTTERTLAITAISNNARVDLDGSGSGVVNLGALTTLDLDVPMADPFSGTLNLGVDTTLDVEDAWQLDGNINVNTSVFGSVGETTITGGLLGLNAGAIIDINEADEVLRFDASLLVGGGTIANSGTIIFDAPAQFGVSSDFQMNGDAASLVVNSDVAISQNGFNLDGNGATTNVVEINEGGRLDLVGTPEVVVDNTIRINGGELILGDYFLELNGFLLMNSSPTASARLTTELGPGSAPHKLGDGVGVGDARLNVIGNGVSRIEKPLGLEVFLFESDSLVNIADGATLEINGLMGLSPGAQLTGEGTLRPGRFGIGDGGNTFNVAVVDLDYGLDFDPDFPAHFIGGHLIINADAIEESGGGFDGDMEIRHDLGSVNPNSGRLTMNVPGGWLFNSGTITLDQISGSVPTMLSGTRMTIGSAATLVVDGGSIFVDAPLTIEGTIEVPNSNHRLNFLPTEASRIEGGLITGLGIFSPLDQLVSGFGTIETRIDDASAEIAADDGTLSITNSFLDIGALRVTDDGVLNITNAWNTEVIDTNEVVLEGGTVQGGLVTNSQFREIRGNGLVTAQVNNFGTLRSTGGGTLVFDSAAGMNGYNNSSNQGDLIADSANLVLRNASVTQSTFGLVRVNSGQEIAFEGFRFNYEPGSRLELNAGTHRSEVGFSFEGLLRSAGTSGSRIVVESSQISSLILSDAEVVLNANLELEIPSVVIFAGATFSGNETLVVDETTRLLLRDGATVGVAIENRGLISPGFANFDDDGVATLGSLEQTDAGVLQFDLGNVAPGSFDSLLVDNNAVLDGTLDVNLINDFQPILGNSFIILETSFGNIAGTFAIEDLPSFNGLTFDVIYNPQSVVLEVVEASFSADFDNDGDVDGDDLTQWQGDYGGPGSDADTDGDSDGTDFLAWQRQFGSGVTGVTALETVPESSTMILAILSVLSCCVYSRPRSLANHCR